MSGFLWWKKTTAPLSRADADYLERFIARDRVQRIQQEETRQQEKHAARVKKREADHKLECLLKQADLDRHNLEQDKERVLTWAGQIAAAMAGSKLYSEASAKCIADEAFEQAVCLIKTWSHLEPQIDINFAKEQHEELGSA